MNIIWKFKTDRRGNSSPAVIRRLTLCEVDLTSAESRSKFGYNFLEAVSIDEGSFFNRRD